MLSCLLTLALDYSPLRRRQYCISNDAKTGLEDSVFTWSRRISVLVQCREVGAQLCLVSLLRSTHGCRHWRHCRLKEVTLSGTAAQTRRRRAPRLADRRGWQAWVGTAIFDRARRLASDSSSCPVLRVRKNAVLLDARSAHLLLPVFELTGLRLLAVELHVEISARDEIGTGLIMVAHKTPLALLGQVLAERVGGVVLAHPLEGLESNHLTTRCGPFQRVFQILATWEILTTV